MNNARRKTQSQFIRSELMDNVREYSNGESAFLYFTEKVTENALFLLDEPENSLSPAKQQELVKFIEDSARFFGCQFVIATHSPFVLAIRGAKIYDLDEEPVDVKRWTELENVRAYYDFFKACIRILKGSKCTSDQKTRRCTCCFLNRVFLAEGFQNFNMKFFIQNNAFQAFLDVFILNSLTLFPIFADCLLFTI